MKTNKSVSIIARIAFKADPRKVCYIVKSSNGKDTYQTCLFNGKATGCSCPSTRPCYHMTQIEAKEAARQAASTPSKADIAATANKATTFHLFQAKYDYRQPTREEHLAEDRAYRMAQIEQAMAERTSRVITEAEETAAAYYRMSFSEY